MRAEGAAIIIAGVAILSESIRPVVYKEFQRNLYMQIFITATFWAGICFLILEIGGRP